MAVNSGQIDLNYDGILCGRENEVPGFKSSGSNVSVGVSHSETLCDEVFHIEDDKDVNVSLRLYPGVNTGCDVMVNGCGNEGFGEEPELVGVGNGLEVGVDGGCDGKAVEFSCKLGENEDRERIVSVIECSDGVLFDYGGAKSDKGFVLEFDDCVQNESDPENAVEVTENGLLSVEVLANSVIQGADNSLIEGRQEVENAALVVNLSEVAEDDNERGVADSSVTKEGCKEEYSHALEVVTYQLQDGIPYMEGVDVNTGESLHKKGLLSRDPLELETSYELTQPACLIDAQVDVMQNQIMDVVDIAESRQFGNVQNECRDINLVVDLNSYRITEVVGMYRESVFSESNFGVTDLVWGKVRGHPWWPGQIFDPSNASEKAKRHVKEGCYLVAYFGDRTFAWNEASMIKPFQMHFSQMTKQSNQENFHHAIDCALDEVSRRVEFGLSCPCIPEELFSTLKIQVISNAGIHKQSSRRNGGDRILNAISFEPMKLVSFVKSLAQSPFVESDRLDFVITHAQLSAFYRSKGYSQLPVFVVLGGLIENDMEIPLMWEKEQELNTHIGYSQKRKHIYYGRQSSKKHKLLSDLMSGQSFSIPNGEHTSEWKASAKPFPRRRGRKRKTAYNTSEDYFHSSQTGKLARLEYVSVNEMLSQLYLTAKDPAGESWPNHLRNMVHFFSEFRKLRCLDYSAYLDQEMSWEQMHDGETGVTTTEVLPSMTSTMEPCNDSYWTDRIIQSLSEEQSLSGYQNGAKLLSRTPTEDNSISYKSEPAAEISTNLGLEPSKPVEHLDESSEECTSPTALTLKFTKLDSVPSTTDLNKIFGRFGPLIESKTELLEKTNRARVVFQRRSDAETAFSSAGKYSIFGPSLVSYRLKILPRKPPRIGTGKRGRKHRNETSSVGVSAV
ncbi:hypothetical protein RJT34_24436 [Clitoria ternatea]|uniref:PWWP domain-containing protein n=1 Tax=Clitoria ternatea TaxID=43366 RepID=A0AAN9IJ80_CLITE